MELFVEGTAVRLRSCHEKYIFADNDEKTIRQSSDGTSRQSIWTVEIVPRKSNFIRLKSCYGKYLTTSESSFLLGMTGERVIQTPPFRQAEYESNWEPIRVESTVKLMSWNGKYLRGNGGSPPWKNSVTCDREQHISTTKKWILWSVELVENPENVSFAASSFNSSVSVGSPVQKLQSFGSSESIGSNNGSRVQKLQTFGSSESIGSAPVSLSSVSSSKLMFTPSISGSSSPKPVERKNSKKIVENVTAMEIFRDAKSVRLRSIAHEKYLIADEDQENVTMARSGSSKGARWRVEMVPGSEKAIRLMSYHGGYLTASNERLMLGATGNKVVQSRKIRMGEPAGEWEPVKDGSKVKLKSRNGGNYLRANGGMAPWRNTVTHDTPNRSVTQSWVVWEVDVVEIFER